VEVQALVVKSTSPHPRLVVNGVDSARVSMLIAVLQKHGGLKNIGDSDVYVSTVGGVRLTEPAVDLAIALALGSAVTGMPIRGDVAVSGEISLAGEIRPANQAARREAEAKRLGYTTLLGPDLARLRDAIVAAVSS
jgi:DNA repair protein RadA/Sms